MKRCKTCGTVVHIESNTCPNCGSHGFEVLDVKVCPLCGKVNDIASTFCEYCGKSFDGGFSEDLSGMDEPGGYAGEIGTPEEPVFNRKQTITDSERAMLHYLTLRPEISSDGKEKKYAYYVTEENVPIVILPTFDTEREKNIKVEIMMLPENRQAPAGSVVERAEGESREDGMQLQLPREPKKRELFSERKVSRKAQVWFSLLLTLFAVGALVGFFLPLAGAGKETGLSLLLGMIGYHDAGQAVVELMKGGGILGILMYVGVLALFSVALLTVVLNLCFLRHKRAKKVVLVILWILAIVAAVLVIVGNAVVLEVSMAGMGIGIYVAAGCSVVGLLATFVLYDR